MAILYKRTMNMFPSLEEYATHFFFSLWQIGVSVSTSIQAKIGLVWGWVENRVRFCLHIFQWSGVQNLPHACLTLSFKCHDTGGEISCLLSSAFQTPVMLKLSEDFPWGKTTMCLCILLISTHHNSLFMNSSFVLKICRMLPFRETG